MHDLRDTIVAASSAAGGVRSVVRIAGPQALSLCEQVFAPRSGISNLKSQISNRSVLAGSVRIGGDLAVDALLYSFLAPHSYTGEDLIELHVFGAACLIEALLAELLAQGFRAAGPGEFTARAYLNGKLDLAQAEAVNEVIAGSNRLQLEAAERLLGGRLTATTQEIRSTLLDTLSLIEAGLDFSGEEIEFIGQDQAAERLADTQQRLEDLLAGSIRYETLMDLPAVGIAGAPNAGKSSLLNALLGWERSIVSPQAKTTRDVLTGVLAIGPADNAVSSLKCEVSRGAEKASNLPTSNLKLETSNLFQCVLFDCAGLIPAPDNVLDELAQCAAIEALQHCTAVLFCVDSAKPDMSEDLAVQGLIQPKTVIHVATKSDLSAGDGSAGSGQELAAFGAEFLPVSAKTGEGLDRLLRAIGDTVQRQSAWAEAHPTDVVAMTARHRQAVTEAIENVRQAVTEMQGGHDEVAVMMIRAACQAIAGIEQEHLDEQVLDRIFSRFCVGK